MTTQQAVLKTTTHNVRIPPLTDVEQLIGGYKSLFNALGIPNEIPMPAVEGFTHPIPAENEKLTADFFTSMMAFKQLKIDKVNVKLVNTRINAAMLVFVFTYEEP